jgi:hypothetical protein
MTHSLSAWRNDNFLPRYHLTFTTEKLNSTKKALATFRERGHKIDQQTRTRIGRRFERYQRRMSQHELDQRINEHAHQNSLEPETLRSKRGPQTLTDTRALLAYELYCHGATVTMIGTALDNRSRQRTLQLINTGRNLPN